MREYGKILFYNEQNGNGVAITKERKKIKFSIEEWNNYDVTPALGLEISFELRDGVVTEIDTLTQESEHIVAAKSSAVSEPIEDVTLTEHAPKCKNRHIDKIGNQINDILNDSSDNLDALDANINLSMDIEETMFEYFNTLKTELTKREGYKKVGGRLNYTLAKRFLWTTFNNLVDIDDNVVTLRISSISDDLKFISKLKDNFDKKIQYPLTAFEDIFLSSQEEYTAVLQMTTEVTERLNLLKSKEEKLTQEREKKKKAIQNESDITTKKALSKEFKVLNGTYVDIIHMMAKLKEIHKKNSKRLKNFETTYKENFYKTFKKKAEKYHTTIVTILDAQAYLLDFLLWKEAKTSHVILTYFQSLSIDLEFNTKTYLKYYLSTLDEAKANRETKELFAFYTYLEEQQKDYVLILAASSHDALDYNRYIQSADKTLMVKSFISELESIKWAMTHSIKVLVLEERLYSTTAKKYLDYYHSNIFSKPKIILIGDSQESISSNHYTISKKLPSSVQSKVLVESLNQLL